MSHSNVGRPYGNVRSDPQNLLAWIKSVSRVLIGFQFLVLGVAAASRAVFLGSFDLSLGEVGETPADWLQRLILLPLQAGLVVAAYLSLTAPMALWYTMERINVARRKKLRAQGEPSDSPRSPPIWGILRARVAGVVAPFVAIAIYITLVNLAYTLDPRLGFRLLGIWLLVWLVIIFSATSALASSDIAPLLRKWVGDDRPLASVFADTVLPPAVLLFPFIIIFYFQPIQVLPFSFIAWGPFDLCAALIVVFVGGALAHLVYYGLNELSLRKASASRSVRRRDLLMAWRIMGGTVLVAFTFLLYAGLYGNTAEVALERGQALPDDGVAGVLHDGIRIYDMALQDSLQGGFVDADYFVQLAQTDDELAVAPLSAAHIEDCDNDCCCSESDGNPCYALGDLVWIPRDAVEFRRQAEPQVPSCS